MQISIQNLFFKENPIKSHTVPIANGAAFADDTFPNSQEFQNMLERRTKFQSLRNLFHFGANMNYLLFVPMN